MAKKILLINQNAILITGRLIPLLKKANVECVSVEPDAETIINEKDSADIFVFIAGDFMHAAKDLLVFLKDTCSTAGKPLCVMGYDTEIEAVEKTIPKNMIAREFVRPMDINTLSSELKTMLNSDGNEEMKQILLVDDDITFLKMMQKWLGAKYHVAAARSGPQALNYLAEHTVDLILLDYEMPLMDGPKVLEAFRSKPQTANIPVIFLTGKDDLETVRSVMSLKPASYLLKSENKEQILQSLDSFLGRR
ncbi:MAG: response regulator [Synergistaceae bacterium]|nr:response regulator [Synergistaceae bacterium]